MKNERLKLIHSDLQSALGNEPKVPVQQPGFDHLETYSNNAKVNNIVRTLVALYGKENILRVTRDWTFTAEGKTLTGTEEFELFMAVEALVRWPNETVKVTND